MSQFKKMWAPIATLIGAVLLANQLAQTFKGDRSIATGTLILVSLLALGGGMWNYAFAKSTVPGIPRYSFHWLAKIALVVILASTLVPLGYILTILEVVPDCCNVLPTQTPTLTIPPTITNTSVPTFTFTPLPSAIPTPEAQGRYYMIVLDASETMNETFDGRSRWDAAKDSLNVILEVLDIRSNYGLVVVGGSESEQSDNPCSNPSSETLSFTSKDEIKSKVRQLDTEGGGSYFDAFNLARKKLKEQPDGTLKTLIFISGPNDGCDDRDEWMELKEAFDLIGDEEDDIKLHSKIIILDEKSGFRTIDFAEKMQGQHENLVVEIPNNNQSLQQSSLTIVNQEITHIEVHQASLTPPAGPPTRTFTPKPTFTSANPMTIYPTFTLAPTRTATPSFTPVAPTVTPTFDTSPISIANAQDVKTQALTCNSGSNDCELYVNVQWISDAQAKLQGKHLSIWVRPLPSLADGTCQEYWPQNPPDYNENGIWSIQTHIGNGSEPVGTEFSIIALVTNVTYTKDDVSVYLPSYLDRDNMLVKRGSGSPPPPSCP